MGLQGLKLGIERESPKPGKPGNSIFGVFLEEGGIKHPKTASMPGVQKGIFWTPKVEFPRLSWLGVPKGPFRTKNTTTIAKIVNYYAVVFLLRPPDLLRHGPFSERENVCNSQENGVRTRCAAIVNHRAIVQILRVVNLLRVVFLVQRGPWGGAL